MRSLELLLIFTTLVATLALWRPPAHRTLCVMLAAAPTLALLLQLGLEGGRWQLLPAYGAAVLAPWGLLRGVRRTGLSLTALLLLAPGVLLAWALPVLEAGPLPGSGPVGVRQLHWTDPSRTDAPGPAAQRRELMLSVWYPASEEAQGPRAAYFPDFDRMQGELAAKLGWPAWAIGHLEAYRQRSIRDARPRNGRYPLILYSHGLNRNRFEAVFRMERLASQGYVVVAVDHPHGADFVLFPDGRVKRFVNQRERDDSLDDIERKRMQRVDRWVKDLRFLMDRIAALNPSDPLWRIVDLERIAAMGFSNGGTSAQVLAARDSRIDAVINLDGTPRGPAVDHRYSVPTLMMHSDPPEAGDEELARWGISREQLQAPSRLLARRMVRITERAAGPAWVVHLRGSAHSNFTDAPRLSPLSHRLGIGGPIRSRRADELIDGAVLRLLEIALKDGDPELLDAWIAEAQELETVP